MHPERLEQLISEILGKKVRIVEVLQNQGILIQEDASFVIMDVVVDVCERYPEFIALYEEVFEFKRKVKELVGVFSEALAVMTKNTERYMVEELQKEVDRRGEEIEKQAGEIEKQRERIQELERMLSEKMG